MRRAAKTPELWSATTFALTSSNESSMPCGSGMSGCTTSSPVVSLPTWCGFSESRRIARGPSSIFPSSAHTCGERGRPKKVVRRPSTTSRHSPEARSQSLNVAGHDLFARCIWESVRADSWCPLRPRGRARRAAPDVSDRTGVALHDAGSMIENTSRWCASMTRIDLAIAC
jgi:hypothetical protein